MSEGSLEPDCCVHCLEPLPEQPPKFCPKCGAPCHFVSGLDPIDAIRSEGHMFRRGAERPNLLIVIGVWIILLPTFVIGIVLTFSGGSQWNQILFWVTFGCMLPGAILFKTTKNYLRVRKEEEKE